MTKGACGAPGADSVVVSALRSSDLITCTASLGLATAVTGHDGSDLPFFPFFPFAGQALLFLLLLFPMTVVSLGHADYLL